ncbi:MAG: hypothetical protein Q9186_005989 [Xanthomendoza sp. 1 TL-2023]
MFRDDSDDEISDRYLHLTRAKDKAVLVFPFQGSTLFLTTFKIDLGRVYQTTSFTYLLRQDGNNHGNIGKWRMSLSADGYVWRLLNGTWADDQELKRVDLGPDPTAARYFKLVAETEAGSRGPVEQRSRNSTFYDASAPASEDLYKAPSTPTPVQSTPSPGSTSDVLG